MVNPAALILLRNDPAVAEEFLQAAIQGDVDAQYGMGLIYAEGRGVEQDEARSFYWLTRAIKQGDNGADLLRKAVAASMTAAQFDQAGLFLRADQFVQSKTRGQGNRRRKRKQQQIDLC